jgi:PAS domain S-box-containing protein
VILLMVIGTVGAAILLDYQSSRMNATRNAILAINAYSHDRDLIWSANKQLAATIAQDPAVISALSSHNRKAAGDIVSGIIKDTSYPGDLTLIDGAGKVFYSTDTPKFSDYSASAKCSGVDNVLTQYRPAQVYGNFSPHGYITLSSLEPVRNKDKVIGVIAASQPLSTEFLTGLAAKLPIENSNFNDIGLAAVSTPSGGEQGSVTASPEIQQSTIVADLNKKGFAGLPKPVISLGTGDINQYVPFTTSPASFENGRRWWVRQDLAGARGEILGAILVCAPIVDIRSQVTSVVLLGLLIGGITFIVALILVSSIAGSVTNPLRYLRKRTEILAKERSSLPPMEGLEGEWLSLGESIETAIANARQSMQSLRNQLNRTAQEAEVKAQTSTDTSAQVDALNRQIAQQSKQLTEVSKQMNFANRQSVLLQRKLDAVLQVSTEGFLVLDQYGNILSANTVFLNWLGVTEGEIAGRLCFDLVKKPGEQKSDFQSGQAFAQHGGDPHALVNQFYPEGVVFNIQKDTSIEVMAHLQPIESEDGSIQAYVMVLRDKSLRSEIARVRNEIVAMLTDSIRAPLVHAEGDWSKVMSAQDQMHPNLAQPLAELHEQYENLIAVIESLLMMYGSFVPPPAAPRESIIVNRLVADCLEEMAPYARDRQLALDYKSVTGLPNLNGNRETVYSIIVALLEKMVSITTPGGRVRVETSARAEEMRIGVLSSGPALPAQEIADMFAGFIEGKHDQAEYGTRLALYLVRNNVERMGGKIWAESDRGTAIYFTAPLH